MQVNRPRFGSAGERTFVHVVLALTALAWIFTLLPGEADRSGIQLTDATVTERRESDQTAVLRISHPTEEWVCEIPRTDFPDDEWPPIGAVIPLVDNRTGCGLPPEDPAPSPAMIAGAVLGTVLLAGWLLYACVRTAPRTTVSRPAATGAKTKKRRRPRPRRKIR